MRSSEKPASTATTYSAPPSSAVNESSSTPTEVPGPRAVGSVPHWIGARSPAACSTIQSWSKSTSAWKGTLGGMQLVVLTPDATPATERPTPATLANIGPPESPKHVAESVPGGPIGLRNEKQTWLVSGTLSHDDVTASPRRRIPARKLALLGLASPIEPKPTMSTSVPFAGSATVLMRNGAMPVTGEASVSNATSL